MRSRTPAVLILATIFLAPASGIAESPPVVTLAIYGTRRALELETRAGEPFDDAKIERDVRRLWTTGWFEDIQVATEETPRGIEVTFTLTEKPRLYLRKVRFEPGVERLNVDVADRSMLDASAASRVAARVQSGLVEQGYADAQVAREIVPVGFRSADLVLKVSRGEHYEFDDFQFTGNTGLDAAELRKALTSIRPRRILPALGPLWGGWRLRAPYSQTRLQSEIARLHSLYLSRGYFDARIDVGGTQITKGRVTLTLRIDSGPRYKMAMADSPSLALAAFESGEELGKGFCRCLHRAREQSEKRGELAFGAHVELERSDAKVGMQEGQSGGEVPSVSATTHIETGPAYRVGRIEFRGHRVLSDLTLRKALILQEGDLFDAGKLRRSLARLGQIAPLQGVDPSDVKIEPNAERAIVNLTIPVKERPRGYWALSGPMGPLSTFGPLSYSMGSRLPAVGHGPLELSTYYMTFSLAAWPTALAGIAGFGSSNAWSAIVALQRPSMPGQRWTSGILVAPQLGWRGTAAGYGLARLSEATRAALRGDSPPAPTLAVPVAWRARGASDAAQPIPIGVLQCPPPKPRLAWLRGIAATLFDTAAGVLLASQGM